MRSHPANSNIEFILTMANHVGDLSDVIIHKTKETQAHCVSDMDLLSVAIAVDDEIAREELLESPSKNLLELYRIRYECLNRVVDYLKQNNEILNNEYGMALRAYVFTHTDDNEKEVEGLHKQGIYEVSATEVAGDFLSNVPNQLYRAFLWYAASYFKSGQENKVSIGKFTAQGLHYQRHFKGELMDFSVLEQSGRLEPIARPEMEENFKAPVRVSMKVDDMKQCFLGDGKLNIDAFELLDTENKECMGKMIDLFDRPGMCISKSDIESRKKLVDLINDSNSRSNFFAEVKPGVVALRYHVDMNANEDAMNAELNRDGGNDRDELRAWKREWNNLSKYAHASAEYLPSFLENLDKIDEFLDILRKVVVMDKTISAATKAEYMIAIIQLKAAVAKEREQIFDSMLARLELVGKSTLLAIQNGNNQDEAFYANIIHDQYKKFVDVKGDAPRDVGEKFKRKDLSLKDVEIFQELIQKNGTADQQNRLKALCPEMIVRAPAHINMELFESYRNPDSVPKDYSIELPGGVINVGDMALSNYVSVEQMQRDELQMDKFNKLIQKRSDLLQGESDPDKLFQAFHIVEITPQDSPYKAYDEFYKLFHEDKIFSEGDRIFFACVYTEKFFPDLVNDRLFIRIISLLPDKFESSEAFKDFCELYLNLSKNDDVGGVFESLGKGQLDEDGFDELLLFMMIYGKLKTKADPNGADDDLIFIGEIKTVEDLRGWNQMNKLSLGVVEENIHSDLRLSEFYLNDEDGARESEALLKLNSEHVQNNDVQNKNVQRSTKSWWKAALIGVGTGLLVGGAVALGIGFGVITAPVTVTALVLAAVVAVTALIGFGIGTLVGKVRDAKRQKPATAAQIQDSAETEHLDNSRRNDRYTRLRQSDPEIKLQSSGEIPSYMHGGSKVNQRKGKEGVSPVSSPRTPRNN